jgi:hypothetical protein
LTFADSDVGFQVANNAKMVPGGSNFGTSSVFLNVPFALSYADVFALDELKRSERGRFYPYV